MFGSKDSSICIMTFPTSISPLVSLASFCPLLFSLLSKTRPRLPTPKPPHAVQARKRLCTEGIPACGRGWVVTRWNSLQRSLHCQRTQGIPLTSLGRNMCTSQTTPDPPLWVITTASERWVPRQVMSNKEIAGGFTITDHAASGQETKKKARRLPTHEAGLQPVWARRNTVNPELQDTLYASAKIHAVDDTTVIALSCPDTNPPLAAVLLSRKR